jgi:hypothetical protein
LRQSYIVTLLYYKVTESGQCHSDTAAMAWFKPEEIQTVGLPHLVLGRPVRRWMDPVRPCACAQKAAKRESGRPTQRKTSQKLLCSHFAQAPPSPAAQKPLNRSTVFLWIHGETAMASDVPTCRSNSATQLLIPMLIAMHACY